MIHSAIAQNKYILFNKIKYPLCPNSRKRTAKKTACHTDLVSYNTKISEQRREIRDGQTTRMADTLTENGKNGIDALGIFETVKVKMKLYTLP